MKRRDVNALHALDTAALRAKIVELRKKLGQLLLEKRSGKLKNLRECTAVRDDIARMMTIVREQELVAKAAGTMQTQVKGAV
jgi:ribosomal protein L29